MNLEQKLKEVGIKIPNILFPREGINLSKFSCVAYNQFDNLYWKEVEKYVDNSPSYYNLIYPKPILDEDKKEDNFNDIFNEKLHNINCVMDKYLKEGIFENLSESFIFVERKARSINRRGLIVAIDLEEFDYDGKSKKLFKISKKVSDDDINIMEKIRENSIIDLSHNILFIDDKEDRLFKKIEKIKFSSFFKIDKVSSNDILYDFDLMKDGGYIKGYKISDMEDIESIVDILIELKNNSHNALLALVGDGIESLIGAKKFYEKTGTKRYALVELVNIYDDGLAFFPIHILLTNVDKNDFFIKTNINLEKLPLVNELQKIIANYIEENSIKNAKLLYFADKKECQNLASENSIAFIYDNFDINNFFRNIRENGPFCNNSFLIGEPKDYRYYLETMEI